MEMYNGTLDTEARTFSLYRDIMVYIQRQQYGIMQWHEIEQGFYSRNIRLAQRSAYIKIGYVVVYIAEQSNSETEGFLTA